MVYFFCLNLLKFAFILIFDYNNCQRRTIIIMKRDIEKFLANYKTPYGSPRKPFNNLTPEEREFYSTEAAIIPSECRRRHRRPASANNSLVKESYSRDVDRKRHFDDEDDSYTNGYYGSMEDYDRFEHEDVPYTYVDASGSTFASEEKNLEDLDACYLLGM